MKTAIVLPSGCRFSGARPNSMETVVRTLARSRRSGDDLLIVCDAGGSDHGDLPVHSLPFAYGRSRAGDIVNILRRFDPDCIEFHQQVRVTRQVGAEFPNAATILYRHNAIRPPANLLDRFRYDRRYAAFDGFVFVSEAAKREFMTTYPRFGDRAFAVCNPIDGSDWTAPAEDRDPVIAFAGRAMPEKGLDVLCRALPIVLERWPWWRATLMLNDWDQHSRWAGPLLEPLAAFGDRVEILRSVPLAQVRDVMARAAIAITPSVWAEPLGLTALEAHAAGAALVSSGRGGLREVSGPHALYLDEVTTASITAALNKLISDPDLRLRLARAGQKHVLDVHSPDRRAAELDEVRRCLVERKRRARCARTDNSPAIA